MGYKQVIETILAGMQLDSDEGKKKAFQKCISYADEHYVATFDMNPFLREAADFLGQQHVVKDAIYEMTPCDGSEKSTLVYSETNGPTFTVNRSGLSFYATLFSNLAKSKMEGEHVHLWGKTHPMCGKTFPLTIYYEGDAWFKKQEAVEITDKPDNDNKIVERNINPEKIAGLVLTTPAPPTLSLTSLRYYKITGLKRYNNEEVWTKSIRDAKDRMYVFSFLDDDNKEVSFAFDLDDVDILFLT